MAHRIILTLIFSFSAYCLFSQDTIGYCEINQDPRIDKLVEKHIKINTHWKGIIGYRVQIYFDSGNNSKKRAMETRAQFLAKHPEMEAYIIFQDPHYKVRVGDFRTKMEAEGFRERIAFEYPGSFVTKDEINLPKLD